MSPGAHETITVVRRNWFTGCISVCPNYDITVSDDGWVVSTRHYYSAPDVVERFRVPPDAVSAFWKTLAPFRPVGSESIPLVCTHDELRPEERSQVIDVTEIEIRWTGGEHQTRLVACDTPENASLNEAIRQALLSVHLYLTGHREVRS
jgi:hypothetical protein